MEYDIPSLDGDPVLPGNKGAVLLPASSSMRIVVLAAAVLECGKAAVKDHEHE